MKTTLLTLTSLLILTACNDPGSSAPAVPAASAPAVISPVVEPVTPIPVVDPVVDPTPTPTPSSRSASITVYSQTKTIAPQASFPNSKITVTGFCATYQAKTYCWDDGIKTLAIFSSSFHYVFWGLGGWSGQPNGPLCWGSCISDSMTVPVEITNTISNHIQSEQADSGSSVSNVFSKGIATQLDCQESDTALDCGSFTITVSQ